MRALFDAPVPAGALFTWVGDLARYPDWLDIVRSATPLPRPAPGDPPPPESAPAWDVVLQARIGPLRRSKRLRMARTGVQDGRWARFERREDDGREHACWSLEARLDPEGGGTRLVMDLRYDGALWSPPLELLLHNQIERSKPRLAELARGGV